MGTGKRFTKEFKIDAVNLVKPEASDLRRQPGPCLRDRNGTTFVALSL